MKILEFPHSHYCEKARWALDYKGIPFQAVAIMPGFHIITVRRYGPNTSVPVLLDNKNAIQGSNEILDYIEKAYPSQPLIPKNAQEKQACLAIERSMDEKLGENIRCILYASLLAYPDFIRHCFIHPMPQLKQHIFKILYPVLRKKIYQSYVISTEKVEQAKREFDVAMSEIEKQLINQQYLVGEQFTRADLSVASMLSLLVMPPEHPFPWQDIPCPQAKSFLNDYKEHPVFEWVSKIYRDHRLCESRYTE